MPTASSYWRDPLSWVCNSGMLVFGISFALLGALLPVLLERLELSVERAGLLFLALNGGAFLLTLIGAPVLDRRGYRLYLVAASCLASAGLWTLGLASGFSQLMVGCFLLGAGGGGLNLGTNALISRLYPDHPAAALNRLGLFFGAGTLVTPLALAVFLLLTAGLASLLQVAAVLALIPGLFFLGRSEPAVAGAVGLSLRATVSRLARPRLMLLGVALFFQSGNEMTIGGWLAAFVDATHQTGPGSAAGLLALFWTALMVGRLVASRVLYGMSASRLVLASAVSCWLLLAVLSSLAGGVGTTALLAAAVGFAMAPLFPTLLGQASAIAPELSATALAVVLLPTTAGAMFFPWLAGELAGSYGVAAVWWIPLVCCPLVAGLQWKAVASRS